MPKLDFVLFGIILLIVAVLLCIAWQTFFGWYRVKRQREAQQWMSRFASKNNI